MTEENIEETLSELKSRIDNLEHLIENLVQLNEVLMDKLNDMNIIVQDLDKPLNPDDFVTWDAVCRDEEDEDYGKVIY